ncbi:peptide chain release factor N(5)-glutamine methyltransferase [Saccharicrinis sp. FJH62]|uniref:peptide chain release factor N(5)-glutamine methyltransferase n=1 Tax=Saccharicrinis sp. FJH62 TaxID=3344657 RepID=UPI0035D477D2
MQKNINYIKQKLGGLYPDREVESFVVWILGHVLGYDKTRILLNNDKILPKDVSSRISSIVDRLTKYEPIQYITGDTEFVGLNLNVRPGVLVPRPETEELVSRISNKVAANSANILDIGTGSGCIALGLKKYMPGTKVFGCDISQVAIELANENAKLNNLDVHFFYYDILSQNGTLPVKKFNMIVSNPPYVLESEKVQMEANVLKYEPHSALFVPDDDPLIFYQRISEFARLYLANDGEIWLEINENKGAEVKRLLENNSFHDVVILKDIFGKQRFVYGKFGE